MSDEGFLRRWSRMKVQAQHGEPAGVTALEGAMPALHADPSPPPHARTEPHPPEAPAEQATGEARLPTLDDVAALTSESDFSAFVTQGVDKTVQRMAMKKLFSDAHFRVMDGLDIYIDDYNQSGPVSAAMLASLDHAKSVFARFMQDEDKAGDAQAEGGSAGDLEQQPPPEGDA